MRATREIAWQALNKTGLAGVARVAIHCWIPSSQVQDLLRSQSERQKRRELLIVQGVGELELQIQKGLVNMDPYSREQMWLAAKSGKAGAQFEEVFDDNVAHLLEKTTPGSVPKAEA